MYLTEQQLNFFHTFGFIHIPQLFTPNEVDWITEEFEHVLILTAEAMNTMGHNVP